MVALFLVIVLTTVTFVAAYSLSPPTSEIPSWIKDTARFWIDDQISDQEFIQALQYLIDKQILVIPSHSKTDVVVEHKTVDLIDLIPFSTPINTKNSDTVMGYSNGLQQAVSSLTADPTMGFAYVQIGIFDNSEHAKVSVEPFKGTTNTMYDMFTEKWMVVTDFKELNESDAKIITKKVGADYCTKRLFVSNDYFANRKITLHYNELSCSYGKVAFVATSKGEAPHDSSIDIAESIVKKLKGS